MGPILRTVAGGSLVLISSIATGLLQEKVVKGTYGPDGDDFTSYSLLILFSSLSTLLLLSLPLAWKSRKIGLLRSTSQAVNAGPTIGTYALAGLWTYLRCLCFFEALSIVSYATLSLGSAQLIPALILFKVFLRRTVLLQEYIGMGIIALGLGAYLRAVGRGSRTGEEDYGRVIDRFVAAMFLVGYLVFDYLASTPIRILEIDPEDATESLGQNHSRLPHLFIVHLFTLLCALVACFGSIFGGNFAPSLILLSTERDVKRDVLALSVSTSLSLFAAIFTSSSLGSGSAARIFGNTGRFTSMLINSLVFRNYRVIGSMGWEGVGWVMTGTFTCIRSDDSDRARDPGPSGESLLKSEASSRAYSPALPVHATRILAPLTSSRSPFFRRGVVYLIPLLLPALSAILLLRFDPNFDLPSTPPLSLEFDEELPFVEAASWETQLHSLVEAKCPNTTSRWTGQRRTVLASNPRSGNTFVRELVEQATNFQTSTISYCDSSLRRTFAGECDNDANFLGKSHYPERPEDVDLTYVARNRIDQAVHLIRNPVDALFSGYMLSHVPKLPGGLLDHAGRLNITRLGSTAHQRGDLMWRARVWGWHEQYWRTVTIPVRIVRYEDIMSNRLAKVMDILSFLLPADELPGLNNLACITESNEAREAYVSRKSPDFASWNSWDEKLRTEIIGYLKPAWCRHGYDTLLRNALGTNTGVDDLCRK